VKHVGQHTNGWERVMGSCRHCTGRITGKHAPHGGGRRLKHKTVSQVDAMVA
jgi:hypothetical protein